MYPIFAHIHPPNGSNVGTKYDLRGLSGIGHPEIGRVFIIWPWVKSRTPREHPNQD